MREVTKKKKGNIFLLYILPLSKAIRTIVPLAVNGRTTSPDTAGQARSFSVCVCVRMQCAAAAPPSSYQI